MITFAPDFDIWCSGTSDTCYLLPQSFNPMSSQAPTVGVRERTSALDTVNSSVYKDCMETAVQSATTVVHDAHAAAFYLGGDVSMASFFRVMSTTARVHHKQKIMRAREVVFQRACMVHDVPQSSLVTELTSTQPLNPGTGPFKSKHPLMQYVRVALGI